MMPEELCSSFFAGKLFPSRAYEHCWDPLDEEKCPEGQSALFEEERRVCRLNAFRVLVGIQRAAKQGGKGLIANIVEQQQCSGISKL
jgi:hypothetical protein